MIKNISNLGDSTVYCDFGAEVNETINSNVIDYFNYLSKLMSQGKLKEINNLTPSYNKLLVGFDLSLTNYNKIKDIILNLNIKKNEKKQSTKVNIPICCDEDYGIDFDRLSKKLNLSKKEILSLYLNREYFCYMTGFIAGMPFLGDVEKKIRCERLETPRVKVPKGSVGITEQFANIYTFESPGGWNIIGKTPKQIFIKSNLKDPALIKPGDKVVFYQISKKEYLNWND